jgi:hypothetical protein
MAESTTRRFAVKVVSRIAPLMVALAAFSGASAQMVTVTTEGYTRVNGQEDWRGPGRLPTRGRQDTLRTGWGRAEVHLGTGSGLYLGPNSLVWMNLLNPREIKFQLFRGTAVLQIAKLADRQKVTVTYRGSKVSVLEAGLYGVDVEGAGLRVFKGKTLVSVGRQKLEVNAGEMTLVDRPLVRDAFGSDAEGTLARWRQWRAQHGEPGFGVPAPFGGRLMAGGGTGSASGSLIGGAGGRVSVGYSRFTAGGRGGGGGGGGAQIAFSGAGPLFLNERPVTAEDEPQPRILDGDVIRTTRDRLEISTGIRTSLWAGENSSVRVASARPPLTGFELLEGTAVLEQSAGPDSASLTWRDVTIRTLEPSLLRLDAQPPVLRVFEGTAEVEVAGEKVPVARGMMLSLDGSRNLAKFNRGKTDSFGLWRVWQSVNGTRLVFRRPDATGWRTGSTPLP